jgi:hypothetical protein
MEQNTSKRSYFGSDVSIRSRSLRVRDQKFEIPKGISIHKAHLEGEIRGAQYILGILRKEIEQGRDPKEAIESRTESNSSGDVVLSRTELYEMAFHCSIDRSRKSEGV